MIPKVHIMALLALAFAQGRFTIPPIYFRYGVESFTAAPYVGLGLATASFAWVSYRLLRGRAWGVPVIATLFCISFSGFAYACSWLTCGCGYTQQYNVAYGLGLMLNADVATFIIYRYRLGMPKTFTFREVLAVR